MATYTHFEASPPTNIYGDPAEPWMNVMGSSYTVANDTTILILNDDKTLTTAHGAFNIVGNTLLGGVVTSLDHTSLDGITTYESITGTWVDALQFVAATPAEKFASALSGTDNLFGYSGNDLLNGYGGADHMFGGTGNDIYVVDNINDVVTEFANQGHDTIDTTLSSYTLPANVEDLYFTNAASHIGFGNGLDNIFTGGTGQDTFYGLGGNDNFDGQGGGDTYFGGTGDDFYNVRAGDVVVEQANEGVDTVNTMLSNYVLPDNVENLKVAASGPAFGNALDNTISEIGGSNMTLYGFGGNDTLISGAGSDTLVGGDGNDKLIASGGHDTLTGGNGDDTFVIGDGNHVITDFGAGPGVHDMIDLADFKPTSVKSGQTIFHDFADVLAHATQNGADTVIDLGAGNSLTLQNVLKSGLSADDFVLSQTPRDFKGDTVSDILWHNDNGAASIWDNGQIGGAHVIATGIDASWHIAGSGDFDMNGSADILWHNDNGSVSIWNDGAIDKAHIIANGVPASWHIAGVADFEGYGNSDILWHNDNGAVSIWDNGNIDQAHIIAKGIDASWKIAGTGDFDGNGRDDILWRNDNGAVSVWDNGDIKQAHIIAQPGSVADSWHFAATGDFDGNGHSDILWHNDNGAVSIWDNGDINQAHIVANAGAIDNSWHIAGTGDYDGNRQSDILWHNDNGAVSVWDNGQIGGAHIVANGVDPSWHIV